MFADVVIIRFSDSAVALTGWGWFIAFALAVFIGGRS
jgi:hypothetical protein